MNKRITRADFTQTDSQWIYAIGKFHLAFVPNEDGTFSLHIYGALEPIPAATQYPTEPEWDVAEDLANKFVDAYRPAMRRDQ